jgi:peptide/histidine transporter 3/4
MAIQGTITNLVLYLLKEYNVESIDATQVANIVEGSLNLVPALPPLSPTPTSAASRS